MNDEVLHRHGQALEEAFFVERNKELLGKLREQAQRDDLKESLRGASGTIDDAALDYLVDSGINPETLIALKLVPLVAVCWANGVVEPAERKTVLDAAEKQGLHAGDPGYGLLESWLRERPEEALFESWKAYVRALVAKADDARTEALKNEILKMSREVAESAGKVFGFFLGTSAEEKAVLREIEQAFSA